MDIDKPTVIFYGHLEGALNGAKKITRQVLDILEKNYKVKIAPYPHNFKVLHSLDFLLKFIKVLILQVKLWNAKNITYYLTGSANSIGFIKDLYIILTINIFCNGNRRIVHFHTDTSKLNRFLKPIYYWVYKDWIHIYLGEELKVQNKIAKQIIIKNPISEKILPPIKQAVKSRKIKIGFFAELNQSKGYFDFVEIIKKLDTNNFEIYSAGKGNSIKMKGYLHRGFLTTNKEKTEYLNNLDLLIYPSYWDAQPLAILEASLLNVVVLAYDVGTIKSMVPIKTNIVEKGSKRKILDLINLYARDKNLLSKHKTLYRDFVLKNFSHEEFERKIIQCFKD